jgi:hypothetical protein
VPSLSLARGQGGHALDRDAPEPAQGFGQSVEMLADARALQSGWTIINDAGHAAERTTGQGHKAEMT